MEKARMRSGAMLALAGVAVALLAAAGAPAAGQDVYTVTPLQSTATDSSLVNGWGLTALAGSPWWVADNGTNVSTLYNAAGAKVALTVEVANAPTGAVANDAGTGFVVTRQTATGPVSGSARFIFSTEEGTILGWSPTVDGTHAILAVPNTTGAIYKGLAIAPNRLYATDFHNARVDVFDSSFHPVDVAGRVRRREPAERICPVRDPERQRHDRRDVREAGRGCRGRGRAPGLRLRRRLRHRAAG